MGWEREVLLERGKPWRWRAPGGAVHIGDAIRFWIYFQGGANKLCWCEREDDFRPSRCHMVSQLGRVWLMRMPCVEEKPCEEMAASWRMHTD